MFSADPEQSQAHFFTRLSTEHRTSGSSCAPAVSAQDAAWERLLSDRTVIHRPPGGHAWTSCYEEPFLRAAALLERSGPSPQKSVSERNGKLLYKLKANTQIRVSLLWLPGETAFVHSFSTCLWRAHYVMSMHLAPPGSCPRGAYSLQVNKYIR